VIARIAEEDGCDEVDGAADNEQDKETKTLILLAGKRLDLAGNGNDKHLKISVNTQTRTQKKKRKEN